MYSPNVTLHFIYFFGILWPVSNNMTCSIEMCNQLEMYTHTCVHAQM